MSPPFDLTMVPGRIAYAISKLGMTLLTHGLAEEVRPHHIAVNSLWPVTIIESQASINWGLGTREAWRKPDILVDCVLRLVRKDPAKITGLALLDEDFLRSEGVTDFGGYACVPGDEPAAADVAGVSDLIGGRGRDGKSSRIWNGPCGCSPRLFPEQPPGERREIIRTRPELSPNRRVQWASLTGNPPPPASMREELRP